jgi:hypothetical protein
MIVVGVLCLVDREQGGRTRIDEALATLTRIASSPAPTFIPVFNTREVRAARSALR